MSIILGALGGMGEAGVSMASNYQKQWAEQDLLAQKAALEEQKAKSLEQFKSDLADKQRGKMVEDIGKNASIIANARMAEAPVADNSTWTPEQEAARKQGIQVMAENPRTQAQAASRAGYIDEAAKMDKIAESGASNVLWGSTRVDGDGNVIYDNGSALKGEINRDRATAAIAAADNRGKPKPLTQDAVDKISEKVIKFSEKATEGMTDPYAIGPEAKGDPAFKKVLTSKLGEGITRAAESEQIIDPNRAIQQLMPKLQQADTIVRGKAEAAAKELFEKPGSLYGTNIDKDRIESLKKEGVPSEALTDANAFKKYYRDTNLEKTFDALLKGGETKNQSAPKKIDSIIEQATGAGNDKKPAQEKMPAENAKKPYENGPNYEKWIAAKERKNEIMSQAKGMSEDRRDSFLRSRIPEIDALIDFHKNYKTF